jgi:integrase
VSRRFGSVRKLPSGRHQASFIDPRSGKRIVGPRTYATKKAANDWLVDVQAAMNRGDLPDIELGRTPFRQWTERWLASKMVKAKTIENYESIVRVHLVPWFGELRINSITRQDVVEFIAYMTRMHSEHVALNCKTTLSSLLNEAKHSGAITRNPAERVKVKQARRRDMVFLSREEVARLAHEIANPPIKKRGGEHRRKHYPEYSLLVRFAAETGLRAGEVAALRVGRLDVINRRILVAESVAEVKKSTHPTGLVYDEPKTYERRSVPIPQTLANELADHLLTRPSDPSAFVFTNTKGGGIRHRNFYRYFFKPAVVRAKLDRKTRFHDLRHTYAALLIEAGAHPLSVKNRLGHSSIKVTYDRYGHLFPHMEEDLTVRMDTAYRNAKK